MYNVIGMWRIDLPKGFSLIELVISIGIMAILSAGVVSLLGKGPQQSSRDSRRLTDLASIAGALEIYRNDNGRYPVLHTALVTNYISSIPLDPKSSSGRIYRYMPKDASGGDCTGLERCVKFYICAAGEKTTTAAAGCPLTCGGTFTCSLVVSSL